MKITDKDLIGEIKDFPIEVVEKMIERQVEQGNKADVEVFQRNRAAGRSDGGFRWNETIDGYEFWDDVIRYKNFKVFFENYPKNEEEKEEEDYWVDQKGRRMLVWDNDKEKSKERIVIAKISPKARGQRYVAVSRCYEKEFENGDEFSVCFWACAKPIPQKTKLSLSTIAEKFGLSVDEIEIDFDK